MDSKKVISELVNNGANNVVKDVTIRNINTTEMTNYARVAITLDKPVKGYVANPNLGKTPGKDGVPADADVTSEYVIGLVNVIFVSNFSLIATLREIPDGLLHAGEVGQEQAAEAAEAAQDAGALRALHVLFHELHGPVARGDVHSRGLVARALASH